MVDAVAFSIVVTTRDRPTQLAKLLSTLSGMDFPRDRFEVIVVDDGSVTPLDAVTVQFSNLLQLTPIRQEHGGPASGRNTGIHAARGRHVAFIDDDCVPDSNWLRVMEAAAAANAGAMIGGNTINGLPQNACSTASQFIMHMVYACNNQDPLDSHFFATNNMVAPREALLAIGGFDRDYVLAAGEDRDLCDRWRHAGRRMIYEPAAVIEHFHELKIASFCRQHFTYGRGAAEFHRKTGERQSGRMRDHFGFHRHLLSWFTAAWRMEPPRSGWKLIVLFVVAQAVNAAGFFYARLRRT